MHRKRSGGNPRTWLIGTWRSNKARTLAEYRWPQKNKAKLQRLMRRILGKLMFRYTAKRLFWKCDERKWSAPGTYRVIWSNADSVFVVSGQEEEEGQLIRFTSPRGYWVSVGRGNVEYFKKLG